MDKEKQKKQPKKLTILTLLFLVLIIIAIVTILAILTPIILICLPFLILGFLIKEINSTIRILNRQNKEFRLKKQKNDKRNIFNRN